MKPISRVWNVGRSRGSERPGVPTQGADDRVGPGHGVVDRLGVGHLADHGADAVAPGGGDLLRVAGVRGDGVAAFQKRLYGERADCAGGAEDGDVHRVRPFWVSRTWRTAETTVAPKRLIEAATMSAGMPPRSTWPRNLSMPSAARRSRIFSATSTGPADHERAAAGRQLGHGGAVGAEAPAAVGLRLEVAPAVREELVQGLLGRLAHKAVTGDADGEVFGRVPGGGPGAPVQVDQALAQTPKACPRA
nr:hypothetical protein [Glycomyces dulcitolivorans]